jgi:hypothetical protein
MAEKRLNINYLNRVKEVNEIYLFYHLKGVRNEYIYKNYIQDKFYISRSTFYNYLAVPYKQLIEQAKTKTKHPEK